MTDVLSHCGPYQSQCLLLKLCIEFLPFFFFVFCFLFVSALSRLQKEKEETLHCLAKVYI